MNRWIGRQIDTQTNTQTDARESGWLWTDKRQTRGVLRPVNQYGYIGAMTDKELDRFSHVTASNREGHVRTKHNSGSYN